MLVAWIHGSNNYLTYIACASRPRILVDAVWKCFSLTSVFALLIQFLLLGDGKMGLDGADQLGNMGVKPGSDGDAPIQLWHHEGVQSFACSA